MKLKTQKRISGQILKCSPKKVKFNTERLNEIKEAITKTDMRGLISDHAVWRVPDTGISRVRARKIAKQKRKGLRKGSGSRKGKANARAPSKRRWIIAVRVQRRFIKELKDKEIITPQNYRQLYRKVKGGFFRSKRHIKLFIEEKNMAIKKQEQLEQTTPEKEKKDVEKTAKKEIIKKQDKPTIKKAETKTKKK